MGKPKTCLICGEYIEGNDIPSMVPYKGRYTHKRCFDGMIKTLKKEKDQKLKQDAKDKKEKKAAPKPAIELKQGLSEEEYKEKKQYYDYLRTLIDGELTSKIYALTENYIKKYGFTYTGMYNTLVYMNEMLGMTFTGDVVGLIPYHYADCETQQKWLEQVEEANKGINKTLANMYKPRTVYVKPRETPAELIDITDIHSEDEV